MGLFLTLQIIFLLNIKLFRYVVKRIILLKSKVAKVQNFGHGKLVSPWHLAATREISITKRFQKGFALRSQTISAKQLRFPLQASRPRVASRAKRRPKCCFRISASPPAYTAGSTSARYCTAFAHTQTHTHTHTHTRYTHTRYLSYVHIWTG